MADEQAGTRPPEPASYDADMIADVTGAYREVETKDVEAPAPEPTSTPSTPAEPRADHPTEKNRYADGTFKPTREDVAQNTANEQHAKAVREQPAQQQQPTEQPQQPAAQVPGGPPSSWSVAAKAVWDGLPEPVRSAISKREVEIESGRQQYSDVAELRDYAQLARSQGQSPREVIERYMQAEQYLRRDFVGGMTDIARGMGISPQQIAQAFAPYLGQSNGQTQGYQQPYDDQQGSQTPGYDPAVLQQYINPLVQEVTNMRAYLQQQQQAEQNRQQGVLNSVLEKFVSDPEHRYFSNVEDRIVQLFRSGAVQRTGDHAADLRSAYEMACLADPEIRKIFVKDYHAKDQAAAQQQQREAAERARRASRSITGSPSGGSPMDFGDDDGSVLADTRRAYRSLAGGV